MKIADFKLSFKRQTGYSDWGIKTQLAFCQLTGIIHYFEHFLKYDVQDENHLSNWL